MKILFKTLVALVLIIVLTYAAVAYLAGGIGNKPGRALTIRNSTDTLLFAHRGITLGYPENSREAILAAKKKGYKALEVDVRKSADGEFVLFHDENCSRLLGIDTAISQLTLQEIKQFNLIMDKDTTRSKVMTLDELLTEFRNDFIIYYDLKLKYFTDADELVLILETHDALKRSVIASTSAPLIFYLEYHYPILTTALEGFDTGKEWMYRFIPNNLKPDFLSGFASKIDEKQVEWLKKHELLHTRIVYGVDSTNYNTMLTLGLKNMIIDHYPELVIP